MVALCRVLMAIVFGSVGIICAHSESVGVDGSRPTASEHRWTILVMAPDGSWGVATTRFIYQGIASAMFRCKKMSGQVLGCGAQIQAANNEWIVVIRCRRTNIIVTGTTVSEAIKSAISRETSMRVTDYGDAACAQVVSVTPQGFVLRAIPDASWEAQEQESAMPSRR